MTPLWLFAAMFVTVTLAFSGVIWMRRRAQPEVSAEEWQDILSFSIDKYRPMQRLLSRADVEFLRSQPGYHPSMLQTLRRERRKVFRSYLRSLRRDFSRIYAAAKQAILVCDAQQSGLVEAVARQRLIFFWALALVETRLALYTLGFGTVDVRPVLDSIEALHNSVFTLRPLPAAM